MGMHPLKVPLPLCLSQVCIFSRLTVLISVRVCRSRCGGIATIV